MTSPEEVSCRLLWPDPNSCAKGSCDTYTGLCICQDGWSSVGDLAPRVGEMCDVNDVAVRCLWGWVLVSSLLGLAQAMHALRMKIKKGNYATRAWIRVPLHRVTASAVVTTVLLGVLSLIKIIDPNRMIGTDPLVSVVFLLVNSLFWTLFAEYVSCLKALVMSQTKTKSMHLREAVHTKAKLARAALFVAKVFGVAAGAAPLFQIGHPDREWPGYAHYVFAGTTICLLCVTAVYYARSVMADVDVSIAGGTNAARGERVKSIQASPELIAFRRKLKIQLIVAILLGIATTANSYIFGGVLWLQRKAAYQVPLNWSIACSACGLIAWATYISGSNNSTSAAKGSSAKGSSDAPSGRRNKRKVHDGSSEGTHTATGTATATATGSYDGTLEPSVLIAGSFSPTSEIENVASHIDT